MKLYRYIDANFTNGIQVQCHEHEVLKETECGYWIYEFSFASDTRKWVSKTGKKRFAYPTKEEALKSFIARKKRQISIYEHKLDNAKIALDKAMNLK